MTKKIWDVNKFIENFPEEMIKKIKPGFTLSFFGDIWTYEFKDNKHIMNFLDKDGNINVVEYKTKSEIVDDIENAYNQEIQKFFKLKGN